MFLIPGKRIVQRRLFAYQTKRLYSAVNNSGAKDLKVNADRLWNDIHYTAQWSAPNKTTEAGGLSRLCGTAYDKMARDWFAEQVKALGATAYTVNATGSQFATFPGQNNTLPPIAMGSHLDSVATGGRFDGPLGVIGALEALRTIKEHGIETFAPIALINWTNEEGARFFPPLGSSCVYAGQQTVDSAYASKANDGSEDTLGGALQSINYVGDGPNTFQEFPISAHFEIHVEQATTLEKAGKSVGWVEGWQGISVFEYTFLGEDGHANTYDMQHRRDSVLEAAKMIMDLETLASKYDGFTTVTNIQSGPVGSCNIQSWTKVVFCLMNPDSSKLAAMAEDIQATVKSRAKVSGVVWECQRIMHLEPGSFWPEAVDCVKRACGDKGIGAQTLTAHDSTMTTLLCPTAMVFARAKDGISHAAKEWTSKEDCAESATVLAKAVLNFDDFLRQRSA